MINGDKLGSIALIVVFLYRCKISDAEYDKDFIESIVKTMRSNNPDVVLLKDMALGIMTEPDVNKTTLKDKIKLALPEDTDITRKLLSMISDDLSVEELETYIEKTKNALFAYRSLTHNDELINKTSYTLNTKELTIEEKRQLHRELKENLLEGSVNNSAVIEGEIDSIDISDEEDLEKKLTDDNTRKKVRLKLGTEELSNALNGGLDTGEFISIQALQHKNKTGLTLFILLQTIFHNTIKTDNDKPPVWIWISLEDDLKQLFTKIYIYIYFRNNKHMPDMEVITDKEMQLYVLREIDKTGNKLILKRIDNTRFTVQTYKNIVRTYQQLGHKVMMGVVDYLEKATEKDRLNNGIVGNGIKHMTTEMRTYNYRENICFMSPHQIATAANDKLRNDVSDKDFLKEIVGKNYTQGSRGLAQDFDIEILIHLVTISGVHYQALQIGKFKRPEHVDPTDKFLMIPFESYPKGTKKGKNALLPPLMEDCSRTNEIIKDSEDDNELAGL